MGRKSKSQDKLEKAIIEYAARNEISPILLQNQIKEADEVSVNAYYAKKCDMTFR